MRQRQLRGNLPQAFARTIFLEAAAKLGAALAGRWEAVLGAE